MQCYTLNKFIVCIQSLLTLPEKLQLFSYADRDLEFQNLLQMAHARNC